MRDGGTVTEIASCTTSTCSFSYRKELKGWNTSLPQRVIYALFPLSQLLTIAAISYWAVGSSCPAWIPVLIIILALACIPVDVLLFRNLKRVRDKARSELRMKTLANQLEAQRQYNLKMQQDMERIKAIHRTADREFQKASRLLEEKEGPHDDSLFADMRTALNSVTLRFCEHPAIDVLAAVKHDECAAAGIDASFAISVPRSVPHISDVELCAVFANLLDNALEAAKRSAEDECAKPFVEMASEMRGNMLVVSTRNSMPSNTSCTSSEDAHMQNPRRRPIFRSIEDHGWGLSIVEGIASRHSGTLVTSMEKDVFSAAAMFVCEDG